MLPMLLTIAGYGAPQSSVGATMYPAAAGMGQNTSQPQGPWSGMGFNQMYGTPPAAAAATGEAGRQLARSMLSSEWHS
jgi:hypothetical protein